MFACVKDRLDDIVNPIHFIGRCPEQVSEFLAEEVEPLLERFSSVKEAESELRV